MTPPSVQSAPLVAPMSETLPLLRVCALLNASGARYLGLDRLIASKETYREQDRLDLQRLRGLKK